jgi:hypothetical protein
MSATLKQIFDANPIVTNDPDDLMYFSRSPYTTGNDAAMSFADFQAQFTASGVPAIDLIKQTFTYVASDTGVADAYEIATTPTLGSYSEATLLWFKPANDNLTSAPTINIDGLGAITLISSKFTSLQAGDLVGNHIYEIAVWFNPFALVYQAIVMNPSITGGGISSNGLYSPTSGYDGNGAWGFIMSDTTGSGKSTANNVWVNGSTSAFFLHADSFTYTGGFVDVFAAGYLHTILGTCYNSSAFGRECTIGGQYSHAVGYQASATQDFSIAMGRSATVTNTGSMVLADGTGTSNTDTNNNQYAATFAGGFYRYIGASLAEFIDITGNHVTKFGRADQSTDFEIPTNGFSLTIGTGVLTLLLDPAGTLATGTITLPPSPINGQEIRVSSSETVTALTVSPNTGQSIKNAPTTLTAGSGFGYIYQSDNTTWYRLY